MAHKITPNVLSLGIKYNQRHEIELIYAANQCKKCNIQRKIISVEWDKPQRHRPMSRSIDEIKSGISTAFLPLRNPLFLTLASAEASGVGAKEVWMGINAIDFSGYPDCTQEFISAYQDMVNIATINPPKIVTPIINMSKPEIASKAKTLGLKKYDTWSCYNPITGPSGLSVCNECDACKLHNYAWSEAGDL